MTEAETCDVPHYIFVDENPVYSAFCASWETIYVVPICALLYNDKNSFLRNKLLSHLTEVDQKYGQGEKNEQDGGWGGGGDWVPEGRGLVEGSAGQSYF